MNEFKILDLFSGAGGFSYGMEKNPHFKTLIALDFNEHALKTFKHNMPWAETIVGDITSDSVKKNIIELSKKCGINMIIGGPPCQGFSLKGKKLGLNDPRNFLFNEYLKIVETLQPDVFVIENVKALLSTSAGWFKDQIVEKVKSMGYFVDYGVLTATDFGVPQTRQRTIFICCKSKLIKLPTRICKKIVTVRDAISDLSYLESNEGAFEQKYKINPLTDYQIERRKGSSALYNHKASNHKDVAIEKLKLEELKEVKIVPSKSKTQLENAKQNNLINDKNYLQAQQELFKNQDLIESLKQKLKKTYLLVKELGVASNNFYHTFWKKRRRS